MPTHAMPAGDNIAPMGTDTSGRHRRSIRLKAYDYTQPGAYFLTICTFDRALLFGDVIAGQMRPGAFGEIAHEEWWAAERKRTDVRLDAWVVMPNHVHGVLMIAAPGSGTARRAPTPPTRRFAQAIPGAVSTLVGAYKSAVARRINKARGTPRQEVWQRGYYERVVRNQEELNRIREYIPANPERWPYDPENPAAVSTEAERDPWEL